MKPERDNVVHIRYCGHCKRPVNHTKQHSRRVVKTTTGEMTVLFHVQCSGGKSVA